MADGYYEMREIDLRNESEKRKAVSFLEGFRLGFDDSVDYTIALMQGGEIAATGSLSGYVIRNVAVHAEAQSEGLMSDIVSRLIKELWRRGHDSYFVYTRPEKGEVFQGMGFREIGRALPYAVLLEGGLGSIGEYCASIGKRSSEIRGDKRAAVVVNCNPFTLGHRALISRAAEENDAVLVFVVAEDRSLFPFAHRFRMVKAGVSHIKNAVVLKGEKYIVSGATFPDYFTRSEDKGRIQTFLDADVFGRWIAPAVGAKTRYVGEEPYCALTEAYNKAMLRVLPVYGVELKVIPRLKIDGEIVSASKVRELIKRDDWKSIKKLVPESTYAILKEPCMADVIEKIKVSDSKH